MSVSKHKILFSEANKEITIPIEMKWDFGGKDGAIEDFQEDMVAEVLGSPNDFEVCRFAHNDYVTNIGQQKTDINYVFNFYSGAPTNVSASTSNDWSCTYLSQNFNPTEIYYYTKPFTKSFFKLDFYDTNEKTTQTNYFTIIIPVQQGKMETVNISPILSSVDIRIPNYKLDYIGDKEGFFIYWLRKREYIDIDTFYMSCKFFNGKTGEYVRMMVEPQSTLSSSVYSFNKDIYFYYLVKLDYNTKTYEVFNQNNLTLRKGSELTPINWYEYVGP